MTHPARAVEAVNSISQPLELSDRMALILRDQPSIERKGQRYAAYHAAGIDLAAYASDETHDADMIALSSELMRRMSQ